MKHNINCGVLASDIGAHGAAVRLKQRASREGTSLPRARYRAIRIGNNDWRRHRWEACRAWHGMANEQAPDLPVVRGAILFSMRGI